jgi:hypothetical protein
VPLIFLLSEVTFEYSLPNALGEINTFLHARRGVIIFLNNGFPNVTLLRINFRNFVSDNVCAF